MRRILLLLVCSAVGCFKAGDDGPTADEATADGTSDATDGTCPVGGETCPCTAGGSCDAGLVCLSNVCVDDSAESSTAESSTDESTTSIVPDEPVVDACDPWLQDCPDGEKCAAYAMDGGIWDANKCVPVLGDGVEGDACTHDGALAGTDTCASGHMCYYTNPEGIGTCVQQCTGSADAGVCPVGSTCSISNGGSLILCTSICDPLLQDCIGQSGCYWLGDLFNCAPAGNIAPGWPCGFVNDCSPGQICVDATTLPSCADSSCCTPFCDLADPVCQIAGTACTSFFDEGTAPPGYESVGVCILPA